MIANPSPACTPKAVLIILWSLLAVPACTPALEKPQSVKWHEVYRPIEDPEALRFLDAGLELLVKRHGPPEIPVRKVMLRHTVKSESAAHYRIPTGFSKTEIVDEQRGVFCIYIAVPPTHERFYYLLGHEIGHLLRPGIIGSAQEERFCNEFSRLLCHQENRAWKDEWETRDWVRQAPP